MPELPEVESLAISLRKVFKVERKIMSIVAHRVDLRFPLPLAQFERVRSEAVRSIERRAKYLRISLEHHDFVVHLGMSGAFRLIEQNEQLRKHDHVEFCLPSGARLVMSDPRRFGFVINWPGSWDLVSSQKLGFEPLSLEWGSEQLLKSIHSSNLPVKALLMNSAVVVGIGNIYASEILFRAGVSPMRLGRTISKKEAQKIVDCSQQILSEAIQAGGSRIRDFRTVFGDSHYQNNHQVYGRKGGQCVICATKIRSKVLSGRSTFWCPHCQPKRKTV